MILVKLLIILVLLYIKPSISGTKAGLFAGNGKAAKNQIYAEVLGAGGYGSINYERLIVNRKTFRIGLRGGFGTYNFYDYRERFNPDMIFPFSLNMIVFAPHTFEIGVGNTFSSIVKANPDNLEADRSQRLSASFFIGYRYSRKEGGIILRVGYTPVIEFYNRYIHGGGISFGYAF